MNLLRAVICGFALCLASGAWGATTYVPSAATDVLSDCLTRSSITAGFADALASSDDEDERQMLVEVLRSRLKRNRDMLNLDEDEDNDVTLYQLKTAFAALEWAYENPGWTPAQAFDITYQRCLKYSKERASGLCGSPIGKIST